LVGALSLHFKLNCLLFFYFVFALVRLLTVSLQVGPELFVLVLKDLLEFSLSVDFFLDSTGDLLHLGFQVVSFSFNLSDPLHLDLSLGINILEEPELFVHRFH